MITLDENQINALKKLSTGKVLWGGVGSGKSRTGLAYYFVQNKGSIDPYKDMENPTDLYIITTAKKRDNKEWEEELIPFLMWPDNKYGNKVVVDSWNNIGKYIDISGAFFLLDEQRLVGSGAWVKAFYKIAKKNEWILLSATPGDCMMDYVPLFIANGYFKNRTEFIRSHVVYNPHVNFPQVDHYVSTQKLYKLRDSLLIELPCERLTTQHHEKVYVDYDITLYKETMRNRWNPFKQQPIENVSELCQVLRKISNSSSDRKLKVIELAEKFPRLIIFYNYDYELDILKNLEYPKCKEIAEWNGHVHQPIPLSRNWVYLVQYNSGAEGWNCTDTNAMIFFSQSYSYKMMVQAAGRIDRRNTKYVDLYYYHLTTHSSIDLAINRALSMKKKFNESTFAKF